MHIKQIKFEGKRMHDKNVIDTGNGKIGSVRDEIWRGREYERIDSRT